MTTGVARDAPLSLDAWGKLPEDVRGEYVDGRVVEEEMPDYAHELIVAWLLHALRT